MTSGEEWCQEPEGGGGGEPEGGGAEVTRCVRDTQGMLWCLKLPP